MGERDAYFATTATCRVCAEHVTKAEAPLHAEDHAQRGEFPPSEDFKVGDRVDSTYGAEHRGTVVEVGAFADGTPMYRIRRDSDGFGWVGWAATMLRVPPAEA